MMEVTTMMMVMKKEKKKKKTFLLCLLVLLFFFSSLGNLSAVPLSRSLHLGNQAPTLLMGANQMVARGLMMEEETARMDIEKDDYPGSGANNRHDPKSPGRA